MSAPTDPASPHGQSKHSLDGVVAALAAEVKRQDRVHPDGYPATRDGLRMGLAAAEDELREALDAWRQDRCKCSTPLCEHATWEHLEEEALQTVAVLVRSLRSIFELRAERHARKAAFWDAR